METPQIKIFEGPVSFNFLKAHLHYIRDLSLSIRVQARTHSK